MQLICPAGTVEPCKCTLISHSKTFQLMCNWCAHVRCGVELPTLQTPLHVMLAEEIEQGGAEKPAASIFLKACDMAACKPHEAIHVGDSLLADIQGAVNAGLQGSVWVNRTEVAAPAGAPACTFQIKHINELQALLQAAMQ